MNVQESFREIRRCGTPWCIAQTPDVRAMMDKLMLVKLNGEEPAYIGWNCVTGSYPINDPPTKQDMLAMQEIGPGEEFEMAPAQFLKKALNAPPWTVLFMMFPDNKMLEETNVAQAIASVRDVFKKDRRTLVLLGGRDLKAPPFVADDIPIIREELPNDEAIKSMVEAVSQAVKVSLAPRVVERAVSLCRGLTLFGIEEAISRKFRKDGIDLVELAEVQRLVVEQSTDRALVFETEKWTFDEVGGMKQFKHFMDLLHKGPTPPRVHVRVDELDKSITAASFGQVADNTGTSQDQLKVLLTSMENNGWTGCLLPGSPGTGKTLSTICAGNEFGCRTLVFDMGACKDSLVGASERKIRAAMAILKAIGGKDVLFLATVNRLDTLPPELCRRFSLGTWFFDVPNDEEKTAIWRIQKNHYKIEDKKLPNDKDWVGSDIRNCCRLASMLRCTLLEASTMITIAGKTAARDIEKLQEGAERCGFLSANYAGSYRRVIKEKAKNRSITL